MNLDLYKYIYLIGIGGMGMSALARYFNTKGKDVYGYENLLKFTKKIFDKGFLELSNVPFDNPFFMIKQIPALLKLKSYTIFPLLEPLVCFVPVLFIQ